MREYYIRGTSIYAGKYIIYENVEEFYKQIDISNVKLHKWAIDNYRQYEVGDYIQAEDGYIVQILAIRELKSKKIRKGKTVFIRFPMGTFAVYEKVDGSIHYPKFYAQFTTGDKNSASGRSRNNFSGGLDEAKKRFARMVFSGIDSRQAFRICFNYKRIITNSQIDKKITSILNDNIFIEELRVLTAPSKKEFDLKFNNDRLLEQLELLLSKCKPGTAAHRENIKFIFRLKGMQF